MRRDLRKEEEHRDSLDEWNRTVTNGSTHGAGWMIGLYYSGFDTLHTKLG